MVLGQPTSQGDYAIGKSSLQRQNDSDNRIDVISWVSASFPKLSQWTKFHFCLLRRNTTKIVFCKADIPQLGCPLSVSIQERIQPTMIFNSVKDISNFYSTLSKRDSNFQINHRVSSHFHNLYIYSPEDCRLSYSTQYRILPSFRLNTITVKNTAHIYKHSQEYCPHSLVPTQSRILPTFI